MIWSNIGNIGTSPIEDFLTKRQGGLGLRWTMGCGNDLIDVRDNTPLVPEPELSALALGMAGMALRKRFSA